MRASILANGRTGRLLALAIVALLGNGCGQRGGTSERSSAIETDKSVGRSPASDVADDATVVVLPGNDQYSYGMGTSVALSVQDASAIADRCTSVAAVAPLVRVRETATFGDRKWVPFRILGTTRAYLSVRNWQSLDEGTNFPDKDVPDGAPVCLIGQTIKEQLFENLSPIGQQVTIGSVPFRVVGVLKRKGSDRLMFDQDDLIVMPWTTVGKCLRATTNVELATISARAASAKTVPDAIREITQVLRDQHHRAKSEKDDFRIVRPE